MLKVCHHSLSLASRFTFLLTLGLTIALCEVQSAPSAFGAGSPKSLAAMHILSEWLRKGIGEPEISSSKPVTGKEGPRKQVCVRFWTAQGNAERQVYLGVEFGKLVFPMSKPPADCTGRRYSRFRELNAMLKMIQDKGENMRPFKPGGHRIVQWRSNGLF